MFSFKSIFVFCRLAKFSLSYDWEKIFWLLCPIYILGYLPSGLHVFASYEEEPNLRISGGDQNQTHDIYTHEVKGSWSYLVIDFQDNSSPFLWILNYVLKRNFVKAGSKKVEDPFWIRDYRTLLQAERDCMFEIIQISSLQFSLTITRK